jgi:hypothetical protein
MKVESSQSWGRRRLWYILHVVHGAPEAFSLGGNQDNTSPPILVEERTPLVAKMTFQQDSDDLALLSPGPANQT